ncbi:MAG TPA: translation initiation factor IF-2 [Clostridia bacterium]
MAEIKKTEEIIDMIKLLAGLKDNNLPKLMNVVKEQKKRLEQIARAFKELKRKKEQQAISKSAAIEEVKEPEEELFIPEEKEKQELKSEQIILEPEKEPEKVEQRVDKVEPAQKQEKTAERTEKPAAKKSKQFKPGQKDSRPKQERPQEQKSQKPAPAAKPNFKDSKPAAASAPATPAPAHKQKSHDKKEKLFEDKKALSKRTLVRRGLLEDDRFDEDEDYTPRYKKPKPKKEKAPKKEITPIKIEKAVITTENLTVKMLSEKIGVPAQEILKKLMILGVMTTINGVVDYDTMELVADEFGVKLEKKIEKTKEEELSESILEEDNPADLVIRPPIVTVMGHVDHGKTSLLDAIRKTNVTEGEAGGITQHIGAYTVNVKDKKITFIDTPGHEAFTALRARGAKVTDIAIIVVAVDDGVMPQTVEAINHAKAANVPIIIAINKIDKPNTNPQRILEQLAQHDVVCEAWGGDSPTVEISAKMGINIDKLLDTILAVAEIYEFKANPNRRGYGTIIESKLDKSKGPVANIIVQNGTLKLGDAIVAGTTYGHVRAMQDDKGRNIKEAGPSMPVSVLGFDEVPEAGELVYVVESEKLAKQVVSERIAKLKSAESAVSNIVTLSDVFNKINEGKMKDLNLIIKADVQGSVEALKESLGKLSNEEVKVNIIHSAVGAIKKTDVMLAEASNAIIIGFNVRADSESKQLAETSGVDIRYYRIIYDAIDDITAAIKGMLTPKFKEVVNGQAEVRNIFKITGAGIVAGCYVTSGKILRNSNVRVLRDNTVVYDSTIGSLKRLKDDVREVASGYECGVTVTNFSDFKIGDVLESYTMEKIE